MSQWRLLPFGGFLLIMLFYTNPVRGAAVMSVDLGSHFMKVGVVSPGVPMEIALNKESKRKTPAVLAFRDGIRTFGEDAQSIGVRFPANAYVYLVDLLGKTVDNPIVQLYRKRFPYYEIVGDEKRNTVIFKSGEEQFSIEELIAQILMKAKEFAQDYTGQPVSECVIIVPGFFGQAERKALLASAQLANLKVLQLMNDYTAVALNYGVFRRNEINETAQYFIFYDMGAQKTQAALVSYQMVKDKTTRETNPVVQVLGVGYDRTLGGLEIQLRLRDYLAKEFNNLKKTKTNVFKNPRAMAKLFKEAGRLKVVLSANAEYFAQVENLIEDIDFKLQVTRKQLEELCEDLWPRVLKPLEQALSAASLPLDVINQVVLFGGSTRVPKVQEILREYLQKDLSKNLNADEAATMGAVYKAADLATGFKVKKVIVKDAVIFPIQIEFERNPGDGSAVKQFKRKLFGPMNPYPQKKFIAFNKHVNDFDFYVNYADLTNLSSEEISYLGSLNLSRVELRKVAEILEKNNGENVESKGIKAHFVLDESGILNMTGVEFIFEKQKTGDESSEGTFSKLGSTISKLFSSDDGKDEKLTEEGKDLGNNTDTEEPTKKNETEAKQNDTSTPAEKETTKNETVKIVTVKEPIEHAVNYLHVLSLTDDVYEEASAKLEKLNQAEQKRRQRESVFNSLEAFVIEAQEKLATDDYTNCATKEEKEEILKECSTISDWLYEGGQEADVAEIEKRYEDIEKIVNEVYAKHWEYHKRPESLAALTKIINYGKNFLKNYENISKEANAEADILTPVEVETLARLMEETIEWQKTEVEAQNKMKCYEPVRLSVKDIHEKIDLIEREVKYLMSKIKIWKQKKAAEKKTTPKPSKPEAADNTTAKKDKGDEPVVEEQVEKVPTKEKSGEKLHTEEKVERGETDKETERESETQTPHGEL